MLLFCNIKKKILVFFAKPSAENREWVLFLNLFNRIISENNITVGLNATGL